MKNLALLIALLFCIAKINAQLGINTTSPQGALEITSSTNGVVVPRVALTSKDLAAPVVNPHSGVLAESTLVWNTATAGTGSNSVFPGFYFWQGDQWHVLVDGSGKDWSTQGNAGTDPATQFIGTIDDTNLVFKTDNSNRMTINTGMGSISGIAGDIAIGDTNSGTIKANSELVMRQDGGGTSVLRLRNRTGENGFILETTGPNIVDFIFKTGPSATPIFSNIRFETRTAYKYLANSTEFQIGKPMAISGGSTLVIGASGAGSLSSFRIGRLGIGTVTPEPESILDIFSDDKGVLIPRVILTSRDNLSPITGPATTGLLVFNTNTVGTTGLNAISPGFYYWDAISSLWMRVATENQVNQSVKYANTDVTTNVNQTTSINLPLVSTPEWEDNIDLYEATTPNSIEIKQAGRYTIVVNVSLLSNVARAAPEIRIVVNTTPVGSYASTGYIRNNINSHLNSSLHLNETLNLAAGDVITIQIVGSANIIGDVLLRSAGTTNLMINKVK